MQLLVLGLVHGGGAKVWFTGEHNLLGAHVLQGGATVVAVVLATDVEAFGEFIREGGRG